LEEAICGNLYDSRGPLGEGCLLVDKDRGVILDVKKEVRGVRKHDFRGKGLLVLPGLIDLHVHLRGLKLSYKEDEFTGTVAALSAGILLVVDMPNTVPRLDRPESLREKLRCLEERAVTDFGVYGGIPKDPSLLRELAKMPIAGFKIYPEDLALREESVRLLDGLEDRRLVVVHPELPEALRPVVEDNLSRGLHRGCHLEASAVMYVAKLVRRHRIHITHASCPSTVREAKGLGLTVDVTPHHVFYGSSLDGCLWKVNPPLRDDLTRNSLLNILIHTDMIDALVSDHAPHAPHEKVDPLSCMSGFAWLEAWPWLFFRLVAVGAMSLERFLELLTVGPARILGVERTYGLLEPGYRANIIVIDPNARWRFPGPLRSKDRHLHLFMRELRGRVVASFLGGELVAEEGECHCEEAKRRKANAFERRYV